MSPEQYTELRDAVIYTKTKTEEMYKRLFGNGQIGVIKEIENRIDVLEDSRSFLSGKWTGVACVLSILMSVLTLGVLAARFFYFHE